MESESRLARLVVWPEFTGSEWQLPEAPVLDGRLLVGWNMSRPPVDGGVPPDVGAVIANALCHEGRVTVPAARRVRGPLRGSSMRHGRDFDWLDLEPSEAASCIFDAVGFSWELQSQVVFVSRRDVVPVLNESYLRLHDEPRWFSELGAAGVLGVLLPGVDGQVAGFYAVAQDVLGSFSRRLEREAAALGAGYLSANARTFGELLRS
jgi:hypothetical protein